jgi:hypothetical protein
MARGRRGRCEFNGNVCSNTSVNGGWLKLAATNSKAKERLGCGRWERWGGMGHDSFCGAARRYVLALFGPLELSELLELAVPV